MFVKNYSIHEKSEYHDKNLNNGWKDDKEKYYFEFHQTRIKELKKMFVDWKGKQGEKASHSEAQPRTVSGCPVI